uniref:Uncharacterized protein n=1 Tax=Anguilla anguilla TaxID=7936 RepID=A0A0E9TYK4_ANGAN
MVNSVECCKEVKQVKSRGEAATAA